jgi:hypothetical protein
LLEGGEKTEVKKGEISLGGGLDTVGSRKKKNGGREGEKL